MEPGLKKRLNKVCIGCSIGAAVCLLAAPWLNSWNLAMNAVVLGFVVAVLGAAMDPEQ